MGKDDLVSSFCNLKHKDFANLVHKYHMLAEWRVRHPLSKDNVLNCPVDSIAVYTRWFDFSNLRLPFTEFFLIVIEYYHITPAQMNPLSVIRIMTFEILFRALGFDASLNSWRHFYRLARNGDWFMVEKQSKVGDVELECFSFVPTSLKKWKENFVWVDASLAPIARSWRSVTGKGFANPVPEATPIEKERIELLVNNKIHVRSYPT